MDSKDDSAGTFPTGVTRFTVRELKEAQALLQRRKDYLVGFFRAEGLVAVRMLDNFIRDPVNHYPVTSATMPLPRLEIQFLNPLFLDAEGMVEGARVAVMDRYINSVAHVYELEKRPYAQLTNNWHARFLEDLSINLRH